MAERPFVIDRIVYDVYDVLPFGLRAHMHLRTREATIGYQWTAQSFSNLEAV